MALTNGEEIPAKIFGVESFVMVLTKGINQFQLIPLGEKQIKMRLLAMKLPAINKKKELG